MKRLSDCPNLSRHTKSPSGYVQWHAWAKKKARRHYQIKCDGCGRYAIWKRKPAAAFTPQGDTKATYGKGPGLDPMTAYEQDEG